MPRLLPREGPESDPVRRDEKLKMRWLTPGMQRELLHGEQPPAVIGAPTVPAGHAVQLNKSAESTSGYAQEILVQSEEDLGATRVTGSIPVGHEKAEQVIPFLLVVPSEHAVQETAPASETVSSGHELQLDEP